MITGEIKNKVDSIWDTLWTGGITSPITVLEQITYLMFMKLLDDNQLKVEANANALGITLSKKVFGDGICVISENPRVETDYKNLRWNVFHNFEPSAMLSNIQNYVFPFIKQIGEGKDTAFSRYMKDTVFLIPTAKVLAKVVDGIDAMDMNNKDIMGDVYEYLLGKIAAAGENGQFRTPRHIIKMIVELMKPTLKDRILDPAMGSAGFLLEASNYVNEHYPNELMKKENAEHYKTKMFSGFDTDQSMLRIGAMNMMLHGVENPNITYQDSLSGDNTDRNCFSLIMANPPFTGSVFQEEISKDILAVTKTKKTELLFMSLFTQMLEVGGRCASIVPDGVLFGSSAAHKAIRKELVENQKLIAVISMPSGVFKPYAGVSTAIVIFTKTNAGGTDKVWFYDMKADGYSLDDKRNPIAENDIPDIIARFNKLAEEESRERTEQSFFVTKDEIADNDYDLSINKYKKVEYGVYLNGEKIVEKRPVKLKNHDFFMIVGYSFYYKDGKIYTDNDKNVHIRNLVSMDVEEQKSQLLYPKFNRSTRKKYKLPSNEIEILSPKAMPSQQKQNFLLLIGPSVAMLALTIILRGVMGGGGTFVIYSAASMCITMIASIAAYVMKNKEIKRAIVKREEDYREYLQGKEEEIKSLRKEELKILQENYKSVDENLEAMSAFDVKLFDRSSEDEDFLQVRIGTGERESNCKIKYKPLDFQDKEDELANLPEITALRYRNLHNAPIISDFAKSDAVGVIGSEDKVYSFFKNIILDLSIRHFYNDVKMICIFNEKDCEKFAWLRWLKHINNDELGIRNLVYDEESNGAILEYIYSVLSEREKTTSEHRNTAVMPNFLVFVFDGSSIKKHPISKYIEEGRRYGFTFIFFENALELLPKGCKEIITLSDKSYCGEKIKSDDSDDVYKFSYEPVSEEIIKDISLRTSPIYVDEVSLESDLTKNISLFDLLGIMNVDDMDLEKRWSESRIEKSMAAPLGVKVKNEVVYLDLHEKKHGPHGLVAGTTGSGKSELLQSYILSAATLFHPYELSFVIIDFKGGGMVNQFEKLPHLIGAITNIDGREIDRSLKSIKAELRKRQELFSQQKVNHINEYIRIYKEKGNIVPLPHLVIIVDEFAELKMEQPEFMKELIVNGVRQPDGTIRALNPKQVADLLGHTTSQITEMYYVKKDTSRLNGVTDGFEI